MKSQISVPKFFCVMGIIVGVIAIFMAFILFNHSTGSYIMSYSYGSDAYTGIQNAMAETGNNVMHLSAIARFGIAALLLVLGLAIICYFSLRLANGNISKELEILESQPGTKAINVSNSVQYPHEVDRGAFDAAVAAAIATYTGSEANGFRITKITRL